MYAILRKLVLNLCTYNYDYKLPGFGGAEIGRYPADDPARDPGRDVGTGGYSIALVRPNLNILTIRKYSLEVLATHINWGLVVKCSNSYFSFLLKSR